MLENLKIPIKITIAIATPVFLLLLIFLYHLYLSVEVVKNIEHTKSDIVIAFFVLVLSVLFVYATIRWMIQYVTQLKATEEAFKESERHLKRAQHISKLGSWYYDSVSGTEVFSNECFEIFGMNKEDYPDNIVPNSTIINLYATPEETSHLYTSLAEKHDIYELEYEN